MVVTILILCVWLELSNFVKNYERKKYGKNNINTKIYLFSTIFDTIVLKMVGKLDFLKSIIQHNNIDCMKKYIKEKIRKNIYAKGKIYKKINKIKNYVKIFTTWKINKKG